MLSKWDDAMNANRPEPLIFEAWDRALVKRLIADELGPDFKDLWGHEAIFTLRVLTNADGEARWCDDVTTKPSGGLRLAYPPCANRCAWRT